MSAAAPTRSPRHAAFVDAEVRRLVRTLCVYGVLHRAVLAERSGARYWTTGQFSEAIARATDRGLIRDLGLGFYATAPRSAVGAPARQPRRDD